MQEGHPRTGPEFYFQFFSLVGNPRQNLIDLPDLVPHHLDLDRRLTEPLGLLALPIDVLIEHGHLRLVDGDRDLEFSDVLFELGPSLAAEFFPEFLHPHVVLLLGKLQFPLLPFHVAHVGARHGDHGVVVHVASAPGDLGEHLLTDRIRLDERVEFEFGDFVDVDALQEGLLRRQLPLGLPDGQLVPDQLGPVGGELFQGDLGLQKQGLAVPGPQLLGQFLEIRSLPADLRLLVGVDAVEFAQVVLPQIPLDVDDLVDVRVDHGLHQNGRCDGIFHREADHHDFGISGEADLDLPLEPRHRVVLLVDARQLGRIGFSQRGGDHEGARDELLLGPFVDRKSVV